MNVKIIRLLHLILSLSFLAGVVYSLVFLIGIGGPSFIGSAQNQITIVVYATGFLAISFSYLNTTSDTLVKHREDTTKINNDLKSVVGEVTENDSYTKEKSQVSNEIDKILKSGSDNLAKVEKVLSVLCNTYNAGQGVLFRIVREGEQVRLTPYSSYAYVSSKEHNDGFDINDGLLGLAVKEDREIEVNDLPKDTIKIVSGLGKTSPGSIVIIPVKENGEMKGVLELSFFKPIDYKLKRTLQEQIHKIGSLV